MDQIGQGVKRWMGTETACTAVLINEIECVR